MRVSSKKAMYCLEVQQDAIARVYDSNEIKLRRDTRAIEGLIVKFIHSDVKRLTAMGWNVDYTRL
ncbi:Hypothetical protein POVR2_LOCUS265 [uncultured virus]|nr:Hypothetical protein POVR2_LOCUS265 [uncultured virus]